MSSSFLADFIAGWVGGIFCVVTGFPFDTVKVRQQTFSTTLLIAVRETYKYEGVLGFFRGMASPLLAYGPSNSIYFGCTGVCMKFLNGSGPNAPNSQHQKGKFLMNFFFSGCVGGFCQAAFMCPVELIKIVLQTTTEGKSPWVHNTNIIKFKGTRHAFKTIVQLEGFRGLYKGFVPMIVRDVPTSGIYFVVYEGLLPNDRKNVEWYHKIWAGGWAGIASISSVLPADVVKTRIQADDMVYPTYSGIIDCIKQLHKEQASVGPGRDVLGWQYRCCLATIAILRCGWLAILMSMKVLFIVSCKVDLMRPAVELLERIKVLIGDNLSSHLD